jgi:DDE superfamily endonuclease
MENIELLLTPAVQAYLIGLIYRNTRTTCLSLSALCPWVSHDTLGRLLLSGLSWSRRLWEVFARHLVNSDGYIVLDDTSWQRWAKKAEAVSLVWCGSVGKVLLGMQVVLLIWTDGKWKVPIGIKLWQKGGPSKVELAQELLSEAANREIRPKYVVFDSWYAAAAVLNLLGELGWSYVAQIKSNRKLNGKSIRHLWPQRYGQAVGRFSKVNHQVRVIKDGRRYWASNDLDLTRTQIKEHYGIRQQIEETFRLLKQEFGWGQSRMRKAQAQVGHLHLGLIALCLTQQAAYSREQTIYAFKRQLFRQSIPDHLPLINDFFAPA